MAHKYSDFCMHPNMPAVMQIYLWAPVYRENWSAFAPDFEELEENREYVEREDEFDTNEKEEDHLAASAAAAAPDAAGRKLMPAQSVLSAL